MLTDKLCAILSALGGNPNSLPDRLDITIIDAIIAQINTTAAVTSAEVVTAVQGCNPTQVGAIKTVLAVTSAEVVTAIQGCDASQVGAIKTALGIT